MSQTYTQEEMDRIIKKVYLEGFEMGRKEGYESALESYEDNY